MIKSMSLAAAAVLIAMGSALAQSATPGPTPQSPTSGRATDIGVGSMLNTPALSEEEIRSRLEKDGYVNVTDLKRHGPTYDAKASKDGRAVNLTVDAATGSVRSSY